MGSAADRLLPFVRTHRLANGGPLKLGTVIIASLIGMTGSSVGVSWALAPTSIEPLLVATAQAAVPEPAVVVAAAPDTTPSSRFVTEGVLRVEGRLGHAVLPTGQAHETFVLVDVEAGSSAASRAPANVAIVLDRSGSMKGRRMTNALAAVRGMIAQLRDEDSVSIVAYDDRASTLLAPTRVRDIDSFGLARTLAQVKSGGHTCISCGIDQARALLRSREGAVDRILLLSDGQANRGVTDVSGFRALAGTVARDRAAIASIGVDLDYDERTMLALSEASNGRHYFVENPGGLAAVFEQERRVLVGTVADRADLEIELADGVELVEVVDRPHARDGNRVTVALGSFAAGEQKTALLRVRVAADAGTDKLAGVRITYRDRVADRDHDADGVLALGRDATITRAAALDPAVEGRLGRKDTFDALISANAAFARGDLVRAERELEDARSRISARKKTSGSKSEKVDGDFDRQLQALGEASQGFHAAGKDVAPTVAATRPKGKSITRRNAATADPFSD